MDQINMLEELYETLPKLPIWNKYLKVCEMYGGIGSQLKSLRNLGIKIKEHYLIEVDIDATISYASIHCQMDLFIETFEFPSKEKMVEELEPYGWWSNDKPKDITKLNLRKLEKLYLAKILTNNMGNVFNLTGKDMPSVDLITWSTPCQDFSLAGKQAGFDGKKGGLTFKTLELFQEMEKLNKLPTFLLFENVPAINWADFQKGFNLMLQKLENLGYKNIVMQLNAKDYGIPQNRNRVFILSIKKEYIKDETYTIPIPIKLEMNLKDMLQDNPNGKYNNGLGFVDVIPVDEKYFISNRFLKYCTDTTDRNGFIRGDRFNPHNLEKSEHAFTITTNPGSRATDNFIIIPEATKKGYAEAQDGDGIYLDRPHQKRGVVQKGMIQTLKTSGNDLGVVVNKTPKDGDGVYLDQLSRNKANIQKRGISTTLKAQSGHAGVVVKGNYMPSRHNASRIVDAKGIAPTVMENHGTVTAVIYDDYNSKIREDQKTIGTITTNIGNSALRNGYKLIVKGQISNEGSQAGKVYCPEGIAPTLCSGSHGYAMGNIETNLRIRKLTPRECWRLMGFDDEDFDNAAKHTTDTQLYKQAGNSIVVNVLMAIFRNLLLGGKTNG